LALSPKYAVNGFTTMTDRLGICNGKFLAQLLT